MLPPEKVFKRKFHRNYNMEQTYLLDIVIGETQFSGPIRTRGGLVWLVLAVDGVSTPVETPKYSPSSTVNFEFPVRFVLNTSSLNNIYLRTMLYTFSDPRDLRSPVTGLAAAKLVLTQIPVGGPVQFNFPLLTGARAEAAVVGLKVALSPVQLAQRATYPTMTERDMTPLKKKRSREEMQASYGGMQGPRIPYPQPVRSTQQFIPPAQARPRP